MPIRGGPDIHRNQITFDHVDQVGGEVRRGQITRADPLSIRLKCVRVLDRSYGAVLVG